MVRNAIADLLRDRGAKVIDVVVADIEMPGQGGFWMIRELLSRPALRLDPAIALTARGRDHRQRILDARFSEHLVKPVDAMPLWDTIQAVGLRAAG